jgi:hypothetical protein
LTTLSVSRPVAPSRDPDAARPEGEARRTSHLPAHDERRKAAERRTSADGVERRDEAHGSRLDRRSRRASRRRLVLLPPRPRRARARRRITRTLWSCRARDGRRRDHPRLQHLENATVRPDDVRRAVSRSSRRLSDGQLHFPRVSQWFADTAAPTPPCGPCRQFSGHVLRRHRYHFWEPERAHGPVPLSALPADAVRPAPWGKGPHASDDRLAGRPRS